MIRKLTTSPLLILIFALSFILYGCGEEGTEETQKSTEEILADSIASIATTEADRQANLTAQLAQAPLYFCGDALVVVRQEPNLSSSEVDQVKLGEDLRFAGELGGDSTGVMVNDAISIDQFAMVLTPRGRIGWVHHGILVTERPTGIDFGTNLPIVLNAIKGAALPNDAWKAIYMNSGECDGAGCPRYFVNGEGNFLLLEVCDAMEGYVAGMYLFYPNGQKQYFQWWEEFYGTQSCHTEAKTVYTIETMTAEKESILELRVNFEFDKKYGEYLLELTEDPIPFVLEEKTGTKES